MQAALTEIRAVARHDPARAAEGAVLFLEKLSPALNQIDSSSGSLGNATCAAVRKLAPLISSTPVDAAVRNKWLDRLVDAIQDDDPPYIESLGDHWGDLCTTPELASAWADQLLPTQRIVLRDRQRGTYAFFSGTTLCYSALFKAGRHDELLDLLAMDPRPIWQYLVWGARVLSARGQVDEAIAYPGQAAGEVIRSLAWVGPSGSEAALDQLRQRLPASELLAVANARARLPTWLASQVSSLVTRRSKLGLKAACERCAWSE